MNDKKLPFADIHIEESDFNKIKDIMYKHTGVFLKQTKMALVQARLRSRLQELGLSKFKDYIPLLEKPHSAEIEIFINEITTNETYFFRHSQQFNYFHDSILMAMMKRGQRSIKIYSAASSTGEEPYSIAITCMEFQKTNPGFDFKIFASDINTEVLSEAKKGIFSERSLHGVDENIKSKYFKPYKFENKETAFKNYFKLDESVIKKVEFFQHNLLDPSKKKAVDVIFLRNVMIYFDKTSKQKVVNNIQDAVVEGGHLIISLSESLNDVSSKFKYIQTGIYSKTNA